ncbi:TolC family protein [Mucilaginibacter pedocola]|nr:TolC family protein [Mucilaginibacter pedocola]
MALATFSLMLFGGQAIGQTNNAKTAPTELPDEQKDLQSQLLPLEDILDIAVKNSPSVKFQSDLIEAAKSQLEFSKRVWTNNITGFVNYSSGNQSIITSDSQTAGNLSSSNITNGYRMGVQINLPLYELVGRKARVNLYKYQLNSTVDKRDESIQELRKNVIQLYYSLLYYNNVLNIRSEAKQSAINQVAVAQKQFKDGVIDIAELSRLKTFEVNARADYEEAKREFSIAYYQVEPVVGVSVPQLMRK